MPNPIFSTIRAISFDLDDTLWPIAEVIQQAERALYQWLREHCGRVVEQHSIESLRAQRDAIWQQQPELRHDYSAARMQSLRAVLLPLGYDEEAVEAAFRVFFQARNRVQFFANAPAVLAKLSAQFPLIAITNGNADLQRIGIDGFFQDCISARSFGIAKPDPRIFHAACRALAIDPAQVLHVGDHPEHDMLGAKQAGMRTAWINRQGVSWEDSLTALNLPLAAEPDMTLLELEELLVLPSLTG